MQVFLFLKYIKDADSIKIESKLQDIEIKLSNGNRILAQAKSSQDYTIATNKKEKCKDWVKLASYATDNKVTFTDLKLLEGNIYNLVNAALD